MLVAGCSSKDDSLEKSDSTVKETYSESDTENSSDAFSSEEVKRLLTVGDYEGATNLLSTYVEEENKEAIELLEYVVNEKKIYPTIERAYSPTYTIAEEITVNFYEPLEGEKEVIIADVPHENFSEYAIMQDGSIKSDNGGPEVTEERKLISKYLKDGKIIEKKFDVPRVVNLLTSIPQIGMPKEIVENCAWPGYKADKKETITAEGSIEVWTYRKSLEGVKVTFTDGRVSEIVK
jgi:hypothetical protein